MKKLLGILLLAAGFVTAWSAEEASAGKFRIASWNIGHFSVGRADVSHLTPETGKALVPEYRAVLKNVNADLFGVAEYSGNYTADGSMKAAETVFPDYRISRIGPVHSYQWNAQFMNQAKVLNTRVVDYEKRVQKTYYLCTELEIGGKKVVWAATHLDWHNTHPTHVGSRASQLRQLVRELEPYKYVIISGDFNVESGEEYNIFARNGYALGNDGSIATYPAGRLKPGKKVVDNIIVKGLKIRDFKVLDLPKLSDHALIYADLEFLP